MPGKRPPPRGAPKGKGPEPQVEGAAPSKGKPRREGQGQPKPKSRATGVPQAAIDASNAARRAGLGGVARKGASEVDVAEEGRRTGAQRCHSSGPPTTGPTRATSGDQARGAVERGSTKGPADRQP